MKKIITVLGARPQFVKAAVLSRIIQKYREIEEVIVHTGQHFDANMSGVFFEEMEIPKPKYHLQIHSLNHGAMTGKMMEEIEKILLAEKPDALIVYGDTNSTLAGALAAKKMHVKVVHIEAGLRSFNMNMPEEINRILTDRISDLLICPTDMAVKNLEDEGFGNFSSLIEKHGDIMKDAVEYYSMSSGEKSDITKRLRLENKNFVIATIHRQENTDNPQKLSGIFTALEEIHKNIPVILPLHPRTKKVLQELELTPQVIYIDPVGYFDMLELLKNCKLVITDSGGLQKEAFFNKKSCIIAREETEWVELVENGFAEITGANSQAIQESYHTLLDSHKDFSVKLYGNNVGEKIYNSILNLIEN